MAGSLGENETVPSPPVRPITDHRGVVHDQDLFRDAEGAPFEVVEAIDDAWEVGFRERMNRRQVFAHIALTASLFGGAAIVVCVRYWFRLGDLATGGLMICLFIGFGVLFVFTPLGRATDRTEPRQEDLDKVLVAGFCACCGIYLKGLPPSDDGCVECPNCSAAWRTPDPRNPSAPPR